MATAPGRQIVLADGRRLGYAEFGDPAGFPVLYCHGLPGSRLEARLTEAAAREVGARVIAADRPGFGLSDVQPERTLTAWPASSPARGASPCRSATPGRSCGP